MIKSSGIGVYIIQLLKPLSAQFSLILLGDPGELAAYKHTAQIISFLTPIYSIKEQYQLSRLVPRCDIFWSPHYNVPVFPVKAKYRVVTIHDVYHLAFGHDMGAVKKIYARFMIGRAVALSKKVITVSNFSKNEIIRYSGCPAEKIQVIYNGVVQQSPAQTLQILQSKYALGDKYILFVGNVKPHKNLVVLLKSYLLLDEAIRNEYQIVVAGKIDGFITGDETAFDLVNNNSVLKGKVTFTGYVDDKDLGGLYHHASVFVFPSLYEGFGIPPLEAMTNACPVIASNAASIPEICGEAALYFQPDDAEGLKKQITSVLSESQLRGQMINKGLERAGKFAWQKSAGEHTSLFKHIISN
ncbi:MAG: glycosyltransferase family 4 protein [Bacteroidetes bacterium]|nr:glycosyltransferase family 4 protein [Bacteroidota bacterium]